MEAGAVPAVAGPPVAEVEETRSWYEARAEGLGPAFVEELDRALALIQERPETWPIYLAGTRRFPFAVIYRIQALSSCRSAALGAICRASGRSVLG